MKRNDFWAVVAIACSIGVTRAAEFKLPEADATPAELVDAALRSELEGHSDLRKTLLDRALKLDSEYAPARWQLGFVRYDDDWLTLDEVAKRVSDDKQLTEYRKRRDAMVDRAEDHRELAIWCKKNQLTDEARVHWANVLEFNPADAEALTALGLQLYEGQLLTKQQIAEAKKLAGERMQTMKRWQPQVVKWRKAIETLKGHDYDYALHEMRKLNDAEALPAIDAVFAESTIGRKADALNLALIETAGRIQSPEATQVLLRRAIQPDSEVVRAAACDQLKKRPMYAYVPQLIAAIPGKTKTRFNIFVLPGGMVLHEHEVFLEGRETDVLMTYTSAMNPADAVGAFATGSTFAREAQSAAAIEARTRAVAQKQDFLRLRVQAALEHTTGFHNAADPELWRKCFEESQGWAYQPTSKRKVQLSNEQIFAAYAPALQTTTTISNMHSCFPAGTLVRAISGLRPIESIKCGDLVLTQNPETGELEFAPVQRTTIRQPTRQLAINTEAGSITTTGGHPFWVVGEGWRTAQQLQSNMALYGLQGAVKVSSVTDVVAAEVYNLVVSSNHTYFVGNQELLVHDNSPLLEVGTVVPGLASHDPSDR